MHWLIDIVYIKLTYMGIAQYIISKSKLRIYQNDTLTIQVKTTDHCIVYISNILLKYSVTQSGHTYIRVVAS